MRCRNFSTAEPRTFASPALHRRQWMPETFSVSSIISSHSLLSLLICPNFSFSSFSPVTLRRARSPTKNANFRIYPSVECGCEMYTPHSTHSNTKPRHNDKAFYRIFRLNDLAEWLGSTSKVLRPIYHRLMWAPFTQCSGTNYDGWHERRSICTNFVRRLKENLFFLLLSFHSVHTATQREKELCHPNLLIISECEVCGSQSASTLYSRMKSFRFIQRQRLISTEYYIFCCVRNEWQSFCGTFFPAPFHTLLHTSNGMNRNWNV